MMTSNTIDTLYFTFLTSNRPLCLKLRLNEWSKAQQPLLWTNIEAGYYIVYILNTYIHTEHYIYKEAVEIRRRLKTPSKLYWTLVTDRVFETYIRFRVFEVHWKKGFKSQDSIRHFFMLPPCMSILLCLYILSYN